jgi:hypothetical protein
MWGGEYYAAKSKVQEKRTDMHIEVVSDRMLAVRFPT